jgi:protein O-mannosyl-transferase
MKTEALRKVFCSISPLVALLLITAAIYWPGLSGGFLFDDYPNIVDNNSVHPGDFALSTWVRAVLSSPSSDFKRPLASFSFAANYALAGLDPYWMKLTNLVIHLLNGSLLYILCLRLVRSTTDQHDSFSSWLSPAKLTAWAITAGWLLLPINVTAVLYVVQRMESLANLFVFAGLIGYVQARAKMHSGPDNTGCLFFYCIASIAVPTALGLLSKETAVMLPLYAGITEVTIFKGRSCLPNRPLGSQDADRRITALYIALLALPLLAGSIAVLPRMLAPEIWANRSFSLGERLLSEGRIVVDYISWTILPSPESLSFYHDDFNISKGMFLPWTTAASFAVLAVMLAVAIKARRSFPLVSLGIGYYLACHILTGTILPLELIYEHRNYFASAGLLIAILSPLTARFHDVRLNQSTPFLYDDAHANDSKHRTLGIAAIAVAAILIVNSSLQTAATAYAWGDPLRLAQELAYRAPQSPRAQYELGRTYIILSKYDPNSPFVPLTYPVLERAAELQKSSILPEQALIFMNSRMKRPVKGEWWESMIKKLARNPIGIQDESSLGALTSCSIKQDCDIPKARLMQAFAAALSHPSPSARLLATYGDYAWNELHDRDLAFRVMKNAVETAPKEPAYRITLARMMLTVGDKDGAAEQIKTLERLNVGGSLDSDIAKLKKTPSSSTDH